MAHILLVEDDRTIRLTLEFALTRAGYGVGTETDGVAGLEAARSGEFDLLLLDLMLPGISGLDVARELRASGSDMPIVMLTALDSEHDKVAGLDAGADDYVTKPFSTNELLARVRAQLRRAHKDRPPTHPIDAGLLHIDPAAMRVERDGEVLHLRGKEYALLLALATRDGALCTREYLTQRVWGQSFLTTSRTLDTHVRRLRKAIDGQGWTYIRTEHGMGYRWEPTLKEADPR